MFGFLFGSAALVGLFMVLRRRRRGFGGRSCGHGRPGAGGRLGAWRGRRVASWLSADLSATPAQERLIAEEIDAFFDQSRGLRREWQHVREDLAKAVRGDAFDEEIMGEAFSRQDDRIRELRKNLVGALARIHDGLDEEQRARLAHLLATGPRWWR